jgi:hypothetical protein
MFSQKFCLSLNLKINLRRLLSLSLVNFISLNLIFISFLTIFLFKISVLGQSSNVQFTIPAGATPDQVKQNPAVVEALKLPPDTKITITQGVNTKTVTAGEIKNNSTGALGSFFNVFPTKLKANTIISYPQPTPKKAETPATTEPKTTTKTEPTAAKEDATKSTSKTTTSSETKKEDTTPKATSSNPLIEKPVEKSDILSSGCGISSPKIKWYNLATPGAFLPIIPADCGQSGDKILALSPVLIPKIAVRLYGLIVSLLFYLLTPVFIIAGVMWVSGGIFGENLVNQAREVFGKTVGAIIFVSMFYLIVFFVFSLFGAENVLDVDLSQFFTT